MKVQWASTYGNIWRGGCWSMWARVLTHVVFSLHTEAERLRKQWEEEEEERLKQMSVPKEPKSTSITCKLWSRVYFTSPKNKADVMFRVRNVPGTFNKQMFVFMCVCLLFPLRVSSSGFGVPPGGRRPTAGLLAVSSWLLGPKRTAQHAGNQTTHRNPEHREYKCGLI